MNPSRRSFEWIAISVVVAGALWAAVALAPSGGAAKSGAVPWAPRAQAEPAGEAAPAQAPLASSADRLLVVPERVPAPAPAVASAPPAAARSRAPARFNPPRLKATRPIVSPNEVARSAAFMSAAQGAAPDAGLAEESSVAAARTVASRSGEMAAPAPVHYGVIDRASLMGRGAGPVYNFRARAKRGSSAQ